MNKLKKAITLLLAFMMVAQLQLPVSASVLLPEGSGQIASQAANDNVSRGQSDAHWAQASLDKWSQYGVIQGYPDGKLYPDKAVTRAELAAFVNRLMGYADPSGQSFEDVPDKSWYSGVLKSARAAGYYEGFPGNLAKPLQPVSRQDAAVLISKALSLNGEAVNQAPYQDAGEISAYAKEPVAALAEALSGYPDGTFRPAQNLTRAELAVILDRLVPKVFPAAKTYQGGEIAGHAVIGKDGVTLEDSAVSGNLYLTSGIGDGNASLNRVEVAGTAFVTGGGAHSIHVKDTNIARLALQRLDGKVRVVTSGSSVLQEVEFKTPALLEIDKDTRVSKLIVGEGAAGSSLTLSGNVEQLLVLSDQVSVNGQAAEKGAEFVIRAGKLEPVAGTAPGAGSSNAGVTASPGGGSSEGGSSGGGNGGNPGVSALPLVDSQASAETRSLFLFLNETRGKSILFGHQHDTTVSFAGKDEEGNVISDVKQSAGDYPAVFGWDTLSLDGLENPPGVAGDLEASRISLSAAMKHAYELGGIVTLSTHPYNFATGGSFNDTGNTRGATQSVVSRILPGGDKHDDFNVYLDRIANFANQLKDEEGKLIPVLFRPFHEQNGSWFWWGAATTTKSEYIELYRYTVEYLRDVKQVRNFLYVYSPNGPFNGSESEYLTTYPGDEYVDILGMDQYDSKENAGSAAFLQALTRDLGMISRLADAKGKIATLSEYGYSAQGMKTAGNNDLNWFTNVLNAIKNDPDARRIAYMLTWANFGEGNNLFVPYKDVPGKEDHELLDDFIRFYKDSYTSFSEEIKRQNVYGRQSGPVAAGKPFLHIVTPTNIGTVSAAPAIIRAKVLNLQPARVTYRIGQGAEMEMSLDAQGYYSAAWLPPAALNGGSAELAVKAYDTRGGTVLEDQLSFFVKVPELSLKRLSFDQPESVSAIENLGTYPEDIKMTLHHHVLNHNGLLELRLTEGLEASQTWQELKLRLAPEALQTVDLEDVHAITLSALIPEAIAGPGAEIQAIAMLPDDWGTKYGMDSTKVKVSELELLELDGKSYYQYDAEIELNDPEAAAAAQGLVISLVGSGLSQSSSESIYVDELELWNLYRLPVLDPLLVDDFEVYGGFSEAAAAKYPKAGGDAVSVELSPERSKAGSYGMKLEYGIETAGYTGVGKSLGTVDWTQANALRLWVATGDKGSYAPEGKPLKLVIQLMIDGRGYEAYPELEPGKEYDLAIPFSSFKVASWSNGGPITKEALQKVTDFKIYVNVMDSGSSHDGVLYFDEIRAVYDANLPEVPTDDDGGSSTPAGVLYSFTDLDSIAGWKLENNTAKAGNPGFAAQEQALEVEFPLVNTGKNGQGVSNEEFELTTAPSGLRLSGLERLSAGVKLTRGTAKARLFIKSGSDWAWHDSGAAVQIDSAGYTTLSISLAAAAGTPGADLNDIKAIGIKLEDIGNDGGMASLLLNEVALHAPMPVLAYTFDQDTEGWAQEGDTMTVSQAVYSDSGQERQVLQSELQWQNSTDYIAVSRMGNFDFSAFDGIEARVKIDSDISGVQAKLFIKLRSYIIWIDSGEVAADGEGFAVIRLDFDQVNPYIGDSGQPPYSEEDLKLGNAIGIQVVPPALSPGSATLYIDEIRGYNK